VTEAAALQKLLTWLSPAFPIGAFAWSAGLETAIAGRVVTDSPSLENWLEGALAHGGPRSDAIFLALAFKATSGETLGDLAGLSLALTPAAERQAETLALGEAFATSTAAWPTETSAHLPTACPYPIAVGAIAAAHALPLEATLFAFLTSIVQGQVSVAVRLVPLGQTAGLRVMAALELPIAALALEATTATLDDLGGIAYATDIAQMRHETLEPRIFRS
jgi:urease accessory protein